MTSAPESDPIEHFAANLAFHPLADLAECPLWDPIGKCLIWVDIFRGTLHRILQDDLVELEMMDANPTRVPTARFDSASLGQPIGAVTLREGSGYVCATRDGIGFIDPWGTDDDATGFSLEIAIECDRPENRMNDARCDPAGALWAGTMATDLSPEGGTLYRISPQREVTSVIRNVSISNGLDWSPDGRTFYYADSPTRRIDVFDCDLDRGHISNRRTLCATPDTAATPDGLAVDARGDIWVALWDGGEVHRYSPDGVLTGVISLPVSRPTSVAFGGPLLDRLYITSARHGLSAEQLRDEPLAGAVFVARPGVCGQRASRYRG